MKSAKKKGDLGESAVVKLVRCPNCGKRLVRLPPSYPLYDVQCSGCSFRAQVKARYRSPTPIVTGAGWNVLHKVLKSGFMVPPLLVLFRWSERGRRRQEIRFYPFVPKAHLKPYRLSASARQANYMMFNYVRLSSLPHFVATPRGSWDPAQLRH